MRSTEVRERFLRYFEERGHRRVPSSSLIPAEDPTLLFTNAGMNQFKDVFTGREKRDYARATTSQKCVRAGGKHNDLDNVGYTGRHHTFFEMLGNFSFGDYFKDEAIALRLGARHRPGAGLRPRPRAPLGDGLHRRRRGVRPLGAASAQERILRFGEKDNFWAMGETGPCGPCSELHYFRGASLADNTAERVNGPGDETLEIWNLVFMQFERDAAGTMTPLPRPSVDTGAGLERISAILQGVNNNFDTDLFAPILTGIERLSGQKYRGAMAPEDAPFRVIADHVAGRDDAHRGRRAALQRGPRLRAAPDPAARHALRPPPGPRLAVPPHPRPDRRRGIHGRLLRAGRGQGRLPDGRAGDGARGGARSARRSRRARTASARPSSACGGRGRPP